MEFSKTNLILGKSGFVHKWWGGQIFQFFNTENVNDTVDVVVS